MPAMTRRRLVALVGATALTAVTTGCNAEGSGPAAEYPTGTIQIMAPAAAGGGWDLTARSIQQGLTEGGLVEETVEVYNVEGAAGTLGLSQLVTKNSGDAHQLMVTGLVMIGGVVTNASDVTLEMVTPIATLTAEQEVVVVPADSEYETLEDLMAAAVSDPESVTWGGGSAGGTDQILVGMLAQAAGADPQAMKYIPYSGGGESKAALLSGDLTAAVSGVSEYKDLVAAGDVRVLATSGAEGVDAGEGKPSPTIMEAGFDVELMNWRGIVAPPGLSDADRDAVIALIDELHASDEWQRILEQQGWDDFYKSGDDAAAYFASENERITEVLREIGLAA
ncbi:Bug family tripartite tricarboxylate transporter substrate binding protein [Stackebrandtia albiflava]|nr:tripartite tricarboxylate transporter substrate binding protein [Stackebrandtia albiflava]